MRQVLFAAALYALLFVSCSGDRSKIDNAQFEIEQGNLENARRLLKTVPEGSAQKVKADSILQSIEGR